MNIEGLDYNTQREKLVMPEYGREIQNMVNHAVTLEDKGERQRCAEAIIAIMSNFQLDVDYPFDVSQAVQIAKKPEPMEYPMKKIPIRHYGSMIFELFDKLKTMEPGDERDELVKLTANQMHRNLMQWSHGSSDLEKVASDLARFTDGKIQLDVHNFKFDKVAEHDLAKSNKKKK